MTLPLAKTVLSAVALAAATVVLIRSIAKDLLPYEIKHFFCQKISFLLSSRSPQITVTIDEVEGLHENQLFKAAEVYLGTKISPSSQRFRAAIPAKETKVIFTVDKNQEVVNVFNGVHLKWTKVTKQLTLSGLLNFIDGLWSSCRDERIIIFTTNDKEHLDPALLRPGRMDIHIHMSYCTPCGFKMLVSNYLGLTDHPIFAQVVELMPEAKLTPAEVGELLLKTEDPEAALEGLLEFLKAKKSDEGAEIVGEAKEEGDMSNGGGVVREL